MARYWDEAEKPRSILNSIGWDIGIYLRGDIGLEITDLPKPDIEFKINQDAESCILNAIVCFELKLSGK